MIRTAMVRILICPSCGGHLEEYTNESESTKNTYTSFALDRATDVIICNNCGFAASRQEFTS